MAILRWIITLPFIIGAVAFAIAHPEGVSITFSPFIAPIELPLYAVTLLFLLVGFFLGILMGWLGMSQTRKERRQYKKEVKVLTKDKEKLENDIEKLEEKLSKEVSKSNPTSKQIIDL